MKKFALTPILIAVALLVGACGTMPRTTSQLEQARQDFAAAQNNPNVARYATSEMQQAGAAMIDANAAADRDDSTEKIDRLANIADRKIAVAQAAATQRYAEAEVARGDRERDQIRLDQRTSEADQARNNAAQSQLAVQAAMGAAADADRQR